MRPVVLVHGIWDSARRIAPLAHELTRRGIASVVAIDLLPPWGAARIETLAEQLARFVERTRQQHGSPQVDIVGFSMGGLVTRVYLEQLGGAPYVHRFVSISAPHGGTLSAYALPLAGGRQMRPRSALLRALGDDVSHLSTVNVHCVYTPYDLTVLPGDSGVLRGARSVHRVPVALHRWMLSDARVLDLTAHLLGRDP